MHSQSLRKALWAGLGATLATLGSTTAGAANDVIDPTSKLYVNWFSGAANAASRLTGQDGANALQLAGVPTAVWVTSGTPAQVEAQVRRVVSDAAAEGAVPVIVAYNVPFRDCQQYSAGGAANTAEYQAWIDGVAAGIGNRDAVVLVEPDGLGIIPHYTSINGSAEWCRPAELDPATAASERFVQLNYAVDRLTALPNTAVYLDGTHSGWLGAGDAAHRLVQAGVQRADGFFVNLSNYEPTNKLEKYGTWISKCIHYGTNTAEGGWRLGHFDWCASQYYPATPGDFSTWGLTDQWYADNVDNAPNPPTADSLAHFVIDTSRNGQGPWSPPPGQYSDAEAWCNPPGRGVGERPTTATGNELIDAKLWGKVPGESDGSCRRGTAGPIDPARGMVDPPAGQWFKEMAAELLANAVPPMAAPTCRVTYRELASWQGLFGSKIIVTNTGATALNGWNLRWALVDGERVIEAVGARARQTRSVATASHLPFNRRIGPGQSVVFAVIGAQDDADHTPRPLFFLNDQACSLR